MSKDFNNFLFDPENIEKTLGLPQDKTIRFPQPRLAQDPSRPSKKGPESQAWYDRWEQMICQLQSKASQLFKLNPNLNFVTNSKLITMSTDIVSESGVSAPNKETGKSGSGLNRPLKWQSDSYMCGDLIILDELDREIYEIFKKDMLTGVPISEIMLDHYEFDKDSPKREDLEFIDEVKSGIDYTLETSVGYLSKSGILGNFTSKSVKNPILPGPGSASDGSKINIIRIVTSSHYTIALHYEENNRLEYFDPGGIFDSIVYVEGVPISGRLSQKSKLRDYKSETVICESEKTEHLMVCKILSNILKIRAPYFVSINTKQLQILEEDIYCQTWVLLYIYLRHVYPKMSAEECNIYFESKTKKPEQLFYLILSWWDYLLYLDTSIWPADFESQYKSLFSKHGGRRKKRKSKK